MEELSKRIPLINQLILKNLDDKSLANFKPLAPCFTQKLTRRQSFQAW